MTRVVVIGGGVAGTAFALLAARHGHSVTVLERDADDVPATVDAAWESWPRRTVPHLRQPHAFVAGVRSLLRTHWPEVHTALLAAGAEEFPLGTREDEVAVGCRRSTLEWVLRRQLGRTPRSRLERGVRVDRLRTRAGAVTGVAAGDREFHADVVVDASGGRTRVPKWARATGIPVRHQDHGCEMVVYSRFYRVPGDGAPPELDAGNAESHLGDEGVCYAFRGDGRVLSVSLARHPDDSGRHRLTDDEIFEHTVAGTPLSRLVASARPLTGVRVLGGFRNALRHHSTQGLFAIGDALCTTNPAYGLGVPLALRHAARLVPLLDDPCAAGKWRDHVSAEVLPYWRAAVRQDAGRITRWRAALGLPCHHIDADAVQHTSRIWQDLRIRHLLDPLPREAT